MSHRSPSVSIVQRPPKRRSAGFSLLELLAAIAIVGVLAAVVFPTFQQGRIKGQQAAGAAALKNLMSTALLFAADNNGAPPGPAGRIQYAVFRKNDTSQILWHMREYLPIPSNSAQNTVLREFMPPLLKAKYDPTANAAYFAVNNIYSSKNDFVKPWGVANADWKTEYPESFRGSMKLASIPSASQRVALIDIDQGLGVAVYQVIPTPLYETSRNAAFWDGHMEKVPLNYNLFPNSGN